MKESVQKGCYRVDFLRQFGNAGGDEMEIAAEGGDIELSLGLSLGGRFGVEAKEKKLVRSSSIATLSLTSVAKQDFSVIDPLSRMRALPMEASLVRTRSLPMETEEEHRKRKEWQSLKRSEAKRKRLERKSPSKILLVRDEKDGMLDGEMVDLQQPASRTVKKASVYVNHESDGESRGVADGAIPPNLPLWPDGASRNAVPQMSPGSHGVISSCLSDDSYLKSEPEQGFDEIIYHSTTSLLPEQINHKTAINPIAKIVMKPFTSDVEEDDSLTKATGRANRLVKDMERRVMEDMPCVSTKGDGPDGKKIEGFLYKYKRGEEVKIVCVCHGRFLTPAEFVKHAGGRDVTHPLKHIVVNTSPSAIF